MLIGNLLSGVCGPGAVSWCCRRLQAILIHATSKDGAKPKPKNFRLVRGSFTASQLACASAVLWHAKHRGDDSW